MLAALTTLLVFQLLGEVIARALAWPVPGPVIGMALMFAMLVMRGDPGEDLRHTSTTLLQHLSLLFVPAGTGIVLYGDRLAAEWQPLLITVVGSTAITIVVTAWVLQRLLRRRTQTGQGPT